MAELPSIPDRLPQVRAPESRVSPGQIASPYVELANNLEFASREANQAAVRLAHEEGLKAVTRDAEGNIQVERAPIIGDAALSYKKATQVAAVAIGEDVIKDDMLKMRHEFKDDPEGFRKAAETYTKQKVGQYEKAAGPDVALALGRISQNTSREFHEGLLNHKEALDLQRNKTAIEIQIETAKNELFALAAGGDTSSPDYVQRLQKVGALWGQLANNPRLAIPKERIEFEMTHLTSELGLANLGYKVAKIQREQGTEAALAVAEQVRTDPSLNLKPAERFSYYTRLVQNIEGGARGEERADRRAIAEIDKAAKNVADGYPMPPAQSGTLRQVAAQSRNPEVQARLNELETVAPIIADWRKASPAQLERNLAETDRIMREQGATPAMIALQKSGTEMLKNMRAGLKTDPLGWADRTGAVPVAPFDWSKPETLDAQMRDRVVAAETVAKHYGIRPSYLRPDERAAITAATAQGGAQMTAVAGAIVSGFGDKAPRVLAEVSKDAPVVAHIGGLMTSNGSPALMRDAAEAVRLRADPQFKLPHWLNKPTDKIIAAQHTETVSTYGGAFALAGDTGRAAEATAQSAYFSRAYRNGYDPLLETSDAKTAYKKTLQEAAGATYDPAGVRFGGVDSYGTKPGTWFSSNRVLIPGNIREGYFGSVIGALKDDDLGGKWQSFGRTYSARDVQNAIPVAVRGGYRFAIGDPNSDDPKWIPDANGRPLVLDLERLESEMRKRVPGAYKGL